MVKITAVVLIAIAIGVGTLAITGGSVFTSSLAQMTMDNATSATGGGGGNMTAGNMTGNSTTGTISGHR